MSTNVDGQVVDDQGNSLGVQDLCVEGRRPRLDLRRLAVDRCVNSLERLLDAWVFTRTGTWMARAEGRSFSNLIWIGH